MNSRNIRIRKKIIKIDYDKTIDSSDYPCVGSIIPLACETIKELSRTHILILDTCRHDQPLGDAIDYLLSIGIVFEYINQNVPSKIRKYGDSRKVYADYSVDDKNLFTPLIDGCVDWVEVRKVFGLEVMI